jgi:ribonuclease BN (tRNA processing enzyme)
MAQLGLDWAGVSHIVLTHFHADHTADIVAFFTAWRYGQLPPRTAPVTVIGPVGTRAFLESVATTFAPDLLSFVPGVVVVDQQPHVPLVLDGGVTLECSPVPHTRESVAWRVDHDGVRLTCSGDTGPSDELAAWAEGSDLLLLECSLPASFNVPIHLAPEDCARIAERAKPRAVWLNHMYPPVEAMDIEGIIGERWAGPLSRAVDGASIHLSHRNAAPRIG